MELEHDHEMGELAQPRDGVVTEASAVQTDERLHATPVVVNGVGPATQHDPHGLQRDRRHYAPTVYSPG